MKPLVRLVSICGLAAAAAAQTVRFEGRVIAYDGTPIVEAGVECAIQYELDTPRLLANPPVETDAQGRFEITVTKPEEGALEALFLHVAAAGRASVKRALGWQKPEIGDIVLSKGQRLFGRVRDVAGKPLANVQVIATDLLEQGNALRSGTSHGFFCATRSEPSGIFKLPCGLPNGARLEFHADGYESAWLEPVAAGTPLEVTMPATGWLQGRILDVDGRSIERARVSVDYELRSISRPVHSAADGSFRVPLRRATRWRITAFKRDDTKTFEGRSDVLTGPRENLEIIARASGESAQRQSLTVKAVTKGDDQPVPEFRAVALWEKYANTNNSYREYRFRSLMKNATTTKGGMATVPPPGENAPTIGAVRVVADGFAPATVTEVEWQEPEAGETTEPLVVELEPEATIRGVVRDEDTGKPVAGASVRARPKPAPNEGKYPDTDSSDAVTTAADGSFLLRGLGEGRWRLIVEDARHPAGEPTDIDLAPAQQLTDAELTLPSGARVAGRLEGIELGGGVRVFLAPLAKQVFGANVGSVFSSYNRRGQPTAGIPVESDGTFAFVGVALANHQLVVRLPSEPRLGGDLFLPIEPFRVRAAGIDRKFDCSEDQPGSIGGRISFSNAQIDYDKLVVVAQMVVGDQRPYFAPYNQRYPGPRSFVQRDGTFQIRVGPGDYRLTVVDLTTSVALHATTEKVTVATGRAVKSNLSLALARVQLSRVAAEGVDQMAQTERVEVRFMPQELANTGRKLGGNETYDSRSGVYWPADQPKLSIVLPAGNAVFLCRNEIGRLRVDNQRWQNTPLGRAEAEITIGEDFVLECSIEAPPEIPAADDAQNEGDADAVREIKIK